MIIHESLEDDLENDWEFKTFWTLIPAQLTAKLGSNFERKNSMEKFSISKFIGSWEMLNKKSDEESPLKSNLRFDDASHREP